MVKVPNPLVSVKGDYTRSCATNWLTSHLSCSIVALLDLADGSLGCSSLVIILERSLPNLGVLLHSLMYVGGSVVTKPPYQVDPAFVLVGLEV